MICDGISAFAEESISDVVALLSILEEGIDLLAEVIPDGVSFDHVDRFMTLMRRAHKIGYINDEQLNQFQEMANRYD